MLGLALAVLLGLLWSSQVSRPVERLAAFSQRVAQGEWDEPLTLESVRELQTLVAALDRMRGDLRAYRERLVASERQAAWSQMARIVAHEVKNPLTPIAISIADLKRSFDQQRPDFPAILEQAVRTIGDEVDALQAHAAGVLRFRAPAGPVPIAVHRQRPARRPRRPLRPSWPRAGSPSPPRSASSRSPPMPGSFARHWST